MIYFLGLVVSLGLLFSPKIEKNGEVIIARPMTISQERKSPAYYLYQQNQLLNDRIEKSLPTESASRTVSLNNNEKNEIATGSATVLNQLVFNKKELTVKADQMLKSYVQFDQDSVLFDNLSAPQPSHQNLVSSAQVAGALVKGTFELIEGVGIVDHYVTLKRMFEGQSVELGRVNLNRGEYEINVGSFEGELVAEIRDQSGLIVGEDRQRLVGLKQMGNYFSGPGLKVGQPSAFNLNVRNVDDRKIAEETTRATFFDGQFDLKKTTDIYPNVASLSSTLAEIKDTDDKNARTISLRLAKDKSETLLFSKKWIDGLQSYLSEKIQLQINPQSGVIIGRVFKDGKPLAGAQVVVENQPGLEPYYLDQWLIPQVQQSTTSENGFFIIPALVQGAYQISAFHKEKIIGTQIYFVENEAVAYQEIQSSSRPQSIVVRSFDAFTSEPMDADVLTPEIEEPLSVVDGFARFRSYNQQGLQEITVRPLAQKYINFKYLQNSMKDHLHLPFIEENFLDQIRFQGSIPKNPETATFIGFVSIPDYELHLTVNEFDRRNIVYFNAQGVPSSVPVQGGGFIIYNFPTNTKLEIILQDPVSDRTYSQAIWAKSDMNYLTHFSE